MEFMLEQLPGRLNEEGYFGPLYCGSIHEEQLSGHSWLLRGLCEHYQAFGDAISLSAIHRITQNLYLPLLGKMATYPTFRSAKQAGGVSGELAESIDGWILSTDIGCAFMSIDGLSHAYEVARDAKTKELLDEMITVYLSIDKFAMKAQTHCTLTAARGMLRMYRNTSESKYLHGAEEIFTLYVSGGGMTKTYQNLNWWDRADSWTEPCAIVDSLMVAAELYQFTQREEYRRLAARIYHNGFSTSQRDNGGAGTDTLICDGSGQQELYPLRYEAYFCCSMRLAEGLWYIVKHQDLLWAEQSGTVEKAADHTYLDHDILYCLPDAALLPFAAEGKQVDGMTLYPIVKAYKVPRDILMASRQKILFD
ncbi:MAG: hypothetical protein IJB81_00705 [Clostridia bacterium]|nr:hypothetical protein [Clostridia bacterium]